MKLPRLLVSWGLFSVMVALGLIGLVGLLILATCIALLTFDSDQMEHTVFWRGPFHANKYPEF